MLNWPANTSAIRKTSDYRHSYRPSDVNELRKSLARNSDYRDYRRHSEHCHTPLGWQDEEEWVDVGDEMSEPSTGRRPGSVPIHKYKHEKFNKSYQERVKRYVESKFAQLDLNDNGYGSASVTPSPDFGLGEKVGRKSIISKDEKARKKASPTSDLDSSGEHKLKDDRRASEKNENMQRTFKIQSKKQDTSHNKKSSPRPRKPTYKVSSHTRPKSAPVIRTPVKGHMQPPIKHNIDPDYLGKPSPFVAYGCKDKELKTGSKKTHNVRASGQIYNSALRAKDRRKMLMEEAEARLRCTSQKEYQKLALLSHLFRKDKAPWDTEYSRAYVEYDKGHYQKSIARKYDPKLAYQAYTIP